MVNVLSSVLVYIPLDETPTYEKLTKFCEENAKNYEERTKELCFCNFSFQQNFVNNHTENCADAA